MADQPCPRCGRPRAHAGAYWNVSVQSTLPDEVADTCGAHLPSCWSDETIPDCAAARIAALEAIVKAADEMRPHVNGSEMGYATAEAFDEVRKKVTL